MAKKYYVTLAQLRRHGACRVELSRFEEFFGARAEITNELALKHVGDFNWWWAGAMLLPPARGKQFFRRAADIAHCTAETTEVARLRGQFPCGIDGILSLGERRAVSKLFVEMYCYEQRRARVR